MDMIPRIIRIEANDPYSAGVRLGESLGRSFGTYLEDYLAARILAAKNCAKPSETHAEAWINALPQHICNRFRGLSEGSGIPFERIAYWGYLEMAVAASSVDPKAKSGLVTTTIPLFPTYGDTSLSWRSRAASQPCTSGLREIYGRPLESIKRSSGYMLTT